MNLNQLLTFNHAAETMNFSRAAEQLNVTQPAVSAQMRQLEEDLGVKLFARLGKKLVLTEPGEVLLGYTRKIFKLREKAETVIHQMRLVQRGTLKLGSAKTYARNIMPPLLADFQQKYPLVNIVLMEGSSLELARRLWSLDVEVAVVAYPGTVRRVQFQFFKSEELVLIVPPGHPLAFVDNVPFSKVAAEPIILREKGSGTRRVISDLYRRHRKSPQVVFETSNADVIKEQVARGQGISFLTRSAVYGDVLSRRLALAKIKDEKLSLDIYTAVLKGHELSRPARAFLDILYGDQEPEPAKA